MNAQERAAFEAWCLENRYDSSMVDGQYCQTVTRHFWMAWQAGRAALVAQQVPAGFVLVPVGPTPEMIEEGYYKLYGELADRSDAERCYRAMLAAAPQAPLYGSIAERAEAGLNAGWWAAAPQVPAVPDGFKLLEDGKTMIPSDWTWCRVEWEPGYPEDVAFGPVRMMERLKKWLERYFAIKTQAPNVPLPAGPGAPQPAPQAPLTDEQIQDAVNTAVKERRLSWLGYKKDELGTYTAPVLSPSDFQFARAIEAAHGIRAAGVKEPGHE